jgi:ribosome recycling factor
MHFDDDIDVETLMMLGEESLDHSIEHFRQELAKIRAGKASPAMLSGIHVEYYGSITPISQIANVGTSDSRTLTIQPWEKNMLGVIEKAIFEANLGLTPMNDGEFVRINIPPLTEERRILLVKQAKNISEDSKVAIRSIRHKMLDFIKKEVKTGYPEDIGKRREDEVEQLVKKYYGDVEHLLEVKEKDIMTV